MEKIKKIKFTEVIKITKELKSRRDYFEKLMWDKCEDTESMFICKQKYAEILDNLVNMIADIVDVEKMEEANSNCKERLLTPKIIARAIVQAIMKIDCLPSKDVKMGIYCYPYATSIPAKYKYKYEGGYFILQIKNNNISIIKYYRGECATRTSYGNGKPYPRFRFYFLTKEVEMKLREKLWENWLGNDYAQCNER